MNKYNNKIAVTTGDINGIGSEIVIKALNELDLDSDRVVIITNKKSFGLYPELEREYEIIDIPYDSDVEFGKISAQSGEFSFLSLKKACEIRPRAIVTAPVSKEALHLAGYKFNGQTEVIEHFLAHDNQRAEMLFVSNGFRVLLLTRHCSLADVPKIITKDLIIEKTERLNNFLKDKCNILNPKLALCSLNPHAGESGILGKEEIDVVIPAVKELNKSGIDVSYPLPSDTLFVKAARNYYNDEKLPYDCYIAMYHDQGLIPIKTVAASKTVNMTIGLDIIRTSPSHGTAFDIAGKNIADYSSMCEAIKEALVMTE